MCKKINFKQLAMAFAVAGTALWSANVVGNFVPVPMAGPGGEILCSVEPRSVEGSEPRVPIQCSRALLGQDTKDNSPFWSRNPRRGFIEADTPVHGAFVMLLQNGKRESVWVNFDSPRNMSSDLQRGEMTQILNEVKRRGYDTREASVELFFSPHAQLYEGEEEGARSAHLGSEYERKTFNEMRKARQEASKSQSRLVESKGDTVVHKCGPRADGKPSKCIDWESTAAQCNDINTILSCKYVKAEYTGVASSCYKVRNAVLANVQWCGGTVACTLCNKKGKKEQIVDAATCAPSKMPKGRYDPSACSSISALECAQDNSLILKQGLPSYWQDTDPFAEDESGGASAQ